MCVLVSCLKYTERMSMKFIFGSVDVCRNLLGKLILIINGLIKAILTLCQAEMEVTTTGVAVLY